jgi:cell division initiation protein
MDLTAQVLHDVEFREAKRGGYNTQDVDEFLERLAVAVERQDAQLREARQRVAAAESRIAEAERRAEDAELRSVGGGGDADETLKRTLVLAQRTADAAIREAEERAARLIASAEDESARMLADAHDSTARAYAEAEEEARRAQHEARSRVLAELQELEGSRELLRADVELLERHIEEQRERLRVAIRELHALVEDPAALRDVPVPPLADVVIPDPEPEPELDPEPDFDLDREPERSPRPRSGRRLVAEPDPDAYEPVQAETPPSRTGPRSPRDEVRLEAETFPDEEEVGDDAYLAELRKAMTDDRPLGPREDQEGGSYEEARTPGRSRFGRRR